MRDKKVTFIVQAAVIAALYVVLTFVANALGLASHTIQVRFSEALCILPVFTPAAIPGLWIGCLLANLLTGAVIYDVIFGSIATLLAAVCTYLLRNHKIAHRAARLVPEGQPGNFLAERARRSILHRRHQQIARRVRLR